MEYDDIVDCKANCDGKQYFDLFDKHIPMLKNDSAVLLYAISNLDCIVNIINKNPRSIYYICDTETIFDLLKLYCENTKLVYVENLDAIIEENMKFDCIVMNPPYSRNLHLKILAEAIKHLTLNGTCVNLSPIQWLAKSNINRPMAKYRKIFNSKIKNIEVIEHAAANAMFGTGNSIEELGIYTVKNNDSNPIDLMNYGFNNVVEKSLYDKINMMNPKAGVITYAKCEYNDKYGMMSTKYAKAIRKPFDVPIYTWHGGKTCKDAVLMSDSKKKVSMVLYFNSQVEHDNFINSLDTVFMNWYYHMFVVPGDYKIINYMFRMADYSQPWDDNRFYKFFNITPEEQKIIEETIAKYK